MPSSRRDKSATWRSTSALGWSKPRLLHELRRGRPYRTFPPGIWIDWWDVQVERSLDLQASQVTIVRGPRVSKELPLMFGLDRAVVGIEVLDGEVPSSLPSPSANAPAASPAPRRPSDARVEQCFLDIKEERPDDPPSESWQLAEMKRRLGAPLARERLRILWRNIAPEWKNPRGHPRKKKSAAV